MVSRILSTLTGFVSVVAVIAGIGLLKYYYVAEHFIAR